MKGLFPLDRERYVVCEKPEKITSHNRIAFILDGMFFNLGSAFLEANTVLPTFVSTLTRSSVLIGLVSTIRSLGYFMPQIFVAGCIEKLAKKKPFMMKAGVAMRLAALGMALSVLLVQKNPAVALGTFYVSLVVLSFSDGFGGLPWMDIVAKTIPPEQRARLFGTMSMAGGSAAFLGGFFIKWLLAQASCYPFNYFWVFFLGFVFLTGSLASMSFIIEPEGPVPDGATTIAEYLKRLPGVWRQSLLFRQVIRVRVLAGAIYLALPFFAIHAQTDLGFPRSVAGLFVSAQMVGTVVAGPVWGYLGDHHGSHWIVRSVTALGAGTGLFALLARIAFFRGFAPLAYFCYFAIYFSLGCIFGGTWIGFSNYVLDIAPKESRSTFMGLLNTVAGPLTLLSLIGGWILQKSGFMWLFVLVALVETLSFYFAWRLPDPRSFRT